VWVRQRRAGEAWCAGEAAARTGEGATRGQGKAAARG
jgi:hypothetical protein